MVKRTAVALVVLLLLSFSVSFVKGATGEIDKIAVVTRVVDGDTFDIDSGERIRLADVDTPETYENGYAQAKNYTNLIDGKTVYLDIDSISRTDPYGRRLCGLR